MNQTSTLTNQSTSHHALHKLAIQLHDETVLLLLDLSVGVEIGRLRERINSTIEVAQCLEIELKKCEPQEFLLCQSEATIALEACRKCLLQLGEERQAG